MKEMQYDSVDAREFALLYEDEMDLNVPGRKQEPEYTYSFTERFKNLLNPVNTNSANNNNLNGNASNPFTGYTYTTKKPDKSREEKGLSSIGNFVSENPLATLLIGAVIAGGAYLVYKYVISEPEESVNGTGERRSGTRLSVKRRSTGRSLKTHTNITINKSYTIDPEEADEAPEDEINENEESVSAKEVGIGMASAVGGSVIGAAIGNASLIASVSLAITGLIYSDWYMTSAAVGMGLTGLWRISKGKESSFFNGLGKDEKLPPEAVQTLLGVFYPQTA